MAPVDPSLQRRIDDAVTLIETDTCFAQVDTSQCEWSDYEIGPGQLDMARSTDEAILVIDSFGPGFFPQLVRYRNRLRGFYQVSGETIEAQTLSVRLPKRLGDVLTSFAGPDFIPASALDSIGRAVADMYGGLGLLFFGAWRRISVPLPSR